MHRRRRAVRRTGSGARAWSVFFFRRARGASVLYGGTEAQKHEIFAARGEQVLSLAVTEPNYGWRPETVRCAQSQQRGSYALNSIKLFDAQAATHLVCAVRTSPPAISAAYLLIVDATAPGVTLRRAAWMSQVDEVRLTNVQVPPPQRSWRD